MKIDDINLTTMWLEQEKINNEMNTNLINALKEKEKELENIKKNKCSEFKMYGYKGLYLKMKKAYDELLQRYNKQTEYYQNALNNCFELDNELTEFKQQMEEEPKEIENIERQKVIFDFEYDLEHGEMGIDSGAQIGCIASGLDKIVDYVNVTNSNIITKINEIIDYINGDSNE